LTGTAGRNARVHGPDGALRREFVLGDGVADVQATATGAVRAAHSDEGIHGNVGWGYHPDARPVGAAGLVRFDARGAKRWEYARRRERGPSTTATRRTWPAITAWADSDDPPWPDQTRPTSSPCRRRGESR
jgi:hypothetical protein